MKTDIYLIANKKGIDRMVKSAKAALNLNRGEIPIKLIVEVPDENWKSPFPEKSIRVDRWDNGVDIEDIQFEGDFVTEEEAVLIREKRLEKIKETLEHNGYEVTKKEDEE